jgi:hypothetical protein
MVKVKEYKPTAELKDTYGAAYANWKQHLEK